MSPIAVAVLGATGTLGGPVTRALLSEAYYPKKISRVIIITRGPSSAKAKAFIELGAEAVQAMDETISAAHLKGIDVLVNCTTSMASLATKNAYAKAAAEAGVKVYFSPDFGSDYTIAGVVHPFFAERTEHLKYARSAAGGHMKAISVHNGGFMEFMISPFAGFDTKNNVYTAWGSTDVRVSSTSLGDVGRAIAQMSVLATNDPASVPDHIRLSGDAKSFKEIADLMSKESGEAIEVKGGDYETIKNELFARDGHAFEHVRLIFTSGTADYTNNSNNELVNPGQSLWKWKTFADYAKETKGKP